MLKISSLMLVLYTNFRVTAMVVIDLCANKLHFHVCWIFDTFKILFVTKIMIFR